MFSSVLFPVASLAFSHIDIDGAYFGATFPHLFFLTFPELKVSKASEVYVPRVFGFRVHKDAYSRSLEARKNVKAQESASKVAPGSGAEGAGERPVVRCYVVVVRLHVNLFTRLEGCQAVVLRQLQAKKTKRKRRKKRS